MIRFRRYIISIAIMIFLIIPFTPTVAQAYTYCIPEICQTTTRRLTYPGDVWLLKSTAQIMKYNIPYFKPGSWTATLVYDEYTASLKVVTWKYCDFYTTCSVTGNVFTGFSCQHMIGMTHYSFDGKNWYSIWSNSC